MHIWDYVSGRLIGVPPWLPCAQSSSFSFNDAAKGLAACNSSRGVQCLLVETHAFAPVGMLCSPSVS